jgi:hypothetical protein
MGLSFSGGTGADAWPLFTPEPYTVEIDLTKPGKM